MDPDVPIPPIDHYYSRSRSRSRQRLRQDTETFLTATAVESIRAIEAASQHIQEVAVQSDKLLEQLVVLESDAQDVLRRLELVATSLWTSADHFNQHMPPVDPAGTGAAAAT